MTFKPSLAVLTAIALTTLVEASFFGSIQSLRWLDRGTRIAIDA